ncbi:MAG: RNA polymerase sigma factor [Phycisphaerae bacterium]|nr:RNA polymerase sigma factor [Phycisphaerae bacterium]
MTTEYTQPGRQARTTATPASCDSKTRKLARVVVQLHRERRACPQMGMQSAVDIEYDTGVEDTDWRDIQASLAGDEESYERLVRRYEPQIAAMMWRFSRRPDQCEELMQDVFVQAYFSLPNFRGDGPFVHWLKRIGTRVGYRFWKQQGRKNKPQPLGDIDPAAEVPETMDPSTASEIVEALLSELKPPERLVLTLQYFDGCSMKEIADRMGWNEAMVKMRAYRARNKLRAIARRRGLVEKLQWTN